MYIKFGCQQTSGNSLLQNPIISGYIHTLIQGNNVIASSEPSQRGAHGPNCCEGSTAFDLADFPFSGGEKAVHPFFYS